MAASARLSPSSTLLLPRGVWTQLGAQQGLPALFTGEEGTWLCGLHGFEHDREAPEAQHLAIGQRLFGQFGSE